MGHVHAILSYRVFYIDDDADVCEAVAATLGRAGLKTSCFTTAEDCIPHLNNGSCDILVTDIRLPGRTGLELLSHVNSNYPWLPVIVVTQYADVTTAVTAMKLGAVDFIEKPFEAESLIFSIRSSLQMHSELDSNCGKALTKAEIRVLSLILDGNSNAEAARILHRSKCTVEVHRKNIMRKLGARNVVDLVLKATAMGFRRMSH